MKTNFGVCAALLAGLTGCMTPPAPPADLASIKLEQVGSPVVLVETAWLERKNGQLAVTGAVIKHLGAESTTNTHLEVTLFDANGQVLRRATEHFEPRQIPRGRRMHGHSLYRVVLDPLPPATARIEVRAEEGSVASPGP